MKRKVPKYVTTEMGADGKERFYFRRPGRLKVRIHGVPWTPSFMAEYETACEGVHQPTLKKKGAFAWLCEQYFSSSEFKSLDDKLSKPKRRNTLLRICREPTAPNSKILFGDVPLSAWNKQAVRVIRDRFSTTPGTVNDMLKALRSIFKYAVDAEHCEANPARDVPYVRGSVDGFRSWSISEIEQYEATHPVGSKERLAMGLMLYTGQRISDAMRLGPANLQDGWLMFTQYKNRNRKPIRMQIPVRPELLELIEATPTGSETFLTNSLNKPYTAHSLAIGSRKPA